MRPPFCTLRPRRPVTSRFWHCECYGDLDEAAGAADATECSGGQRSRWV
jgi:hypothetical protein